MSGRFKTKTATDRVVVSLCCCVCGQTEKLNTTTGERGHHLPDEAISRAFRRKGWFVAATARKDRCPEHAKPHRKPAQEAPKMAADTKVIDIRSPQPGASDLPPREMTKTDRRLVIAKLEEVYEDEATGYSTGWHDERVAKDMAVPRAWVELIREENFGPIKAEQSAEVQSIRLAIEETDRVLANANRDLASLGKDCLEIGERQKQLLAVIAGATALLQKARSDVAKLTGKA